MKKKKRISSTTAIILRVMIPILVLWLYGMAYLTKIAAKEIQNGWIDYPQWSTSQLTKTPTEHQALRNDHFSNTAETNFLDSWILNNGIDLSFCEAVSYYPDQSSDFLCTESICYPYKGESITYIGITYPNLKELVITVTEDFHPLHDSWEHNRITENLWEIIYITYEYYDDGTGILPVCSTAIHGYPIKAAMWELLPTYLLTAAVLAGLIILLWRSLRKHLGKPLQQLQSAASDESNDLPACSSHWREVNELHGFYVQIQQTLHQIRQENQQLQTALDYAEDAEIRRRELVSNITHELKTPLAVIHSYAEGLSEGIAENKKDQYLNIIQDEAQRMDGMVMEMLDLSRLEAGKVQLASDKVCLSDMTKQIFEKLALLVEEKKLMVNYDLDKFDIVADESRIAQVITNFATNAIKYSPQGGQIRISVGQSDGNSIFRIENQCEPLSQEALEHIWDSFYRTDASRSSKGTGLGLAIAKTIIELHRGTCSVENTAGGVAFSFTLPC